MKIIIDADACPKSVLQACLAIGQEEKIPVWTVASFNHHIVSDHHIVVGNASQEADMKVLNVAVRGDIAVTQDWGLAAMLLGKGVYCVGPDGRVFEDDTIEFMLETRDTLAKVRRNGGRTKGPKKRTGEDDVRFTAALKKLIVMALA